MHVHKHTCSAHTHLVMLQFIFQAVQVVENKFFVQLIVGITDKPPNSFSFCFKILPGAQNCLEVMKNSIMSVGKVSSEKILHIHRDRHQSLNHLSLMFWSVDLRCLMVVFPLKMNL